MCVCVCARACVCMPLKEIFPEFLTEKKEKKMSLILASQARGISPYFRIEERFGSITFCLWIELRKRLERKFTTFSSGSKTRSTILVIKSMEYFHKDVDSRPRHRNYWSCKEDPVIESCVTGFLSNKVQRRARPSIMWNSERFRKILRRYLCK